MRKLKIIFAFVLTLSIAFLGLESFYLSVNRLKVRTVEIENDSIPDSFDDTKIMVFSDIYGDLNNFNKLLDAVDKEKPDFIIFLGNMFGDTLDNQADIENHFKLLKAPLGKYAVLSQQDFKNNETVRTVLSNADFRTFDASVASVHRYTDESIDFALFSALDTTNSQEKVSASINEKHFTLGLTHSPDLLNTTDLKKLDLMVAGETNLGKVNLPMIGSVFFKDKPTKPKQVINEVTLYLTSGISTQSPKVRLGSSPDILILQLKSSQ